jgi:hypothetical protein
VHLLIFLGEGEVHLEQRGLSGTLLQQFLRRFEDYKIHTGSRIKVGLATVQFMVPRPHRYPLQNHGEPCILDQ